MPLGWLLARLAECRDTTAVIWQDEPCPYDRLAAQVRDWSPILTSNGVTAGTVTALVGHYSPGSISLLLALLQARAIVVPLSVDALPHRDEFFAVAGVEHEFAVDANDRWTHTRRGAPSRDDAPLYQQLRTAGHPGIVLFSSGSTGPNKAAVHDATRLLERFQVRRHRFCVLTFLLFDHIGGLNTLFYGLANGGTVVSTPNRTPDAVCGLIERHRVDLLPVSPTFLNLLLMSDAWRRHDLSSLKRITYGTEVMPLSTLHRLKEAFPGVILQQTYGLSETGILQTKSRDDGSVWMRVGGQGYETKVVDGVLWIRSSTAMLGYLNAASPFDKDGWMNTQDAVEVDGEYLHILGRRSDVINVGGQKVFPAEVESVLLQLSNVRDAAVYGEPNPIMGQVVATRVNLSQPEDEDAFRKRARRFCRERLAPHKMPVRIELTGADQFTARFKKTRGPASPDSEQEKG